MAKQRIDLWNSVEIMNYLTKVRWWHGYVKLLGLPHMDDEPDIPLDKFFVTPCVSNSYLSPDFDPTQSTGREEVLGALAGADRMVLLGDPGSGKSTLTSWLSLCLASPVESSVSGLFPGLCPVPMVLRELKLGRHFDWNGLLDAFLALPMTSSSGIRKETLKALFEAGQAFVILDGLDEVSPTSVKKALYEAVAAGMGKYPGCRWLATSRIVGYEEEDKEREEAERRGEKTRPEEECLKSPFTDRRYLSPFDDVQESTFLHNWYVARVPNRDEALQRAKELAGILARRPDTRRLARIPNLLAMIALIHRSRVELPHGRANLFDDIARAYLDSIDKARGIRERDYPFRDKKHWLSTVAFRMQQKRDAGDEYEDRSILATRVEVVGWIAGAMGGGYGETERREAFDYVDYVARRSGLLLPRGEGLFAFQHLSLQEYFAASHLATLVTSPYWLPRYGKEPEGDYGEGEPKPEELRELASTPHWGEVFLLLFEILAQGDRGNDWPKALSDWLFGPGFEEVRSAEMRGVIFDRRLKLMAELAIDPYCGLARRRREMIKVTLQRALESHHYKTIAGILLSAPEEARVEVWDSLRQCWDESSPKRLVLSGERDWGRLGDFRDVRALDLDDSDFRDLHPLVGLKELISISFNDTQIIDLAPLEGLKGLTSISFGNTQVTDLSPLTKLKNLERLYFYSTEVSDLSPLAGLKKLSGLYLGNTPVADLSPLAGLKKLRRLSIYSTKAVDLSPLSELNNLETLDLEFTKVDDLSPLVGLKKLKTLDLENTHVADLSPLAGLNNLTNLFLDNTQTVDLTPLAGLKKLRAISLKGTPVTDYSPLEGIEGLKIIR